jgi:uncharacterized protein YxeA
MKKQKIEVIVLIVFVIVAALIWVFEWNKETPAVQITNSIEKYQVLAEEDPQIRWGEMINAQKTEYKSNGRNPFTFNAPPTKEEIKDRQKKADDAAKAASLNVPPPPTAPTVAVFPPNLKFFGYGTIPVGSTRRAFFSDGDSVYIVLEGETLLGRYRILKVGNTNLEFQEITSGLHGTAPLDEQAVVSPSA